MNILETAKANGWQEIESKDPYMISFHKIIDNFPARINVWNSETWIRRTVGTYLNHPKQGRSQLFRKFVTDKEMQAIFKNPRVHSGKGYR